MSNERETSFFQFCSVVDGKRSETKGSKIKWLRKFYSFVDADKQFFGGWIEEKHFSSRMKDLQILFMFI